MDRDKGFVREELINKLLSVHGSRPLVNTRLKVGLWELTVNASYFVKRAGDIAVSAILIVLLTPVYIITALAIFIESPGPVIFKQARVGLNGRHFLFYKFRSMVLNAEKLKKELEAQNQSADGVIFKMKDDPRITRVGKFIRKYSVDELPQLFNVLAGDMSLVGPRPPVPKEVAEYTLEDRKRLHMKPGITCIWQISGRSDIPFKRQVELDKEYIKSRSFLKDIVILLKTIPAVITGRGAY
jgi:exopolysaccharide biosynthesis polyprenyl glycosylphosphotransferase